METAAANLLQNIWLCILAATLLAYLAQWTRQPLILAYILGGVVLGPIGLKVISEQDAIMVLANLGLAFLLFIVGLEMDLRRLITTGKRCAPIAAIQVVVSVAMGWALARALGYDNLASAYIGAAVALSSTMIGLKILADRAEVETAHGQMFLGVSLLQDLAAIAILAVQPVLGSIGGKGGEAGEFSTLIIILTPIKGAGLVAGAILFSRYILPALFRWVSRSPEIMVLSALSWCFLVCYAAIELGFSVAMGALIAGVSMSAFPYSLDVIAKIRGLRVFFVTLFFVSLGMLLTTPTPAQLLAAGLISLVVIVSRFVTVWPAHNLGGYTSRVGLIGSIYLAQTSEFGLVLALVGLSSGHISGEVVSVIVLVLIVTSTASTYMITYSHKIAALFIRDPKLTEADRTQSTVLVRDEQPAPIVLVGCFRNGSSLVHELRQAAIDFSVIDFSQNVNDKLNRLGVPTVYGDISHMDTLEHAGVDKAQIIIAVISDDFLRGTDNMRLYQTLRKLNPSAKIIVTSDSIRQAGDIYKAGADYVLVPRVLIARHLMEVIAEIGAGELQQRRDIEIEHLPQRAEVVP